MQLLIMITYPLMRGSSKLKKVQTGPKFASEGMSALKDFSEVVSVSAGSFP